MAPKAENSTKLSQMLTFTNFLKESATLSEFQEVCDLGARTVSSLTGTEAAMVWITAPGAGTSHCFTGLCGLEEYSTPSSIDLPKLIKAAIVAEGTAHYTHVNGSELGLAEELTFPKVVGISVPCTETIGCWVGALALKDTGELDAQTILLLQSLAHQLGLLFRIMQVNEPHKNIETSYQAIVENLPAAVYIRPINAPWKSSYMSPQAKEILGFEIDEMLGNQAFFVDQLHPDDRERILAEQAIFKDGKSTSVTAPAYRMIHKNGQVIWLLNHLHTVWNEDGTPTHVCGVLIDVTEIEERARRHQTHAAEEEKLRQIAQAANQAKSRFLASMSHEIRTPMNAIMGYGQLLQRESGLTDRQRNFLETIDRSGVHLLSLINDVLDMAKIEAGEVTVVKAEMDFANALLNIERMFRLRAAQTGITLAVEIDPSVPSALITDAGKVRQVLINLLSNAIKFTETGGIVVRVSTMSQVDENIRILIAVEDTGHGIEPDKLDDIFKAFVQTDTGSQKSGTGLGLAVSQQFAHLLEGSISTTSTLGIGSVFKFEFVAQTTTQMTLEGPASMVLGLVPNTKVPQILVVDDEENNRLVLSAMLRSVGFKVRAASSGKAALESFRLEPSDIALLDLRMPDMDGVELMGHLHALRGDVPLKVIIVSASTQDKQQTLTAGADDFLFKPLREADLFASIGQHCGVQFVYTEEGAEIGVNKPTTVLVDADSVRQLPVKLLDNLRKAVDNAEFSAIAEYLAQVSQINPELGHRLLQLADRFDYESLLALLNEE